MFKFKLQKTALFVKLFYNFFHRKNIIVLIGSKGTSLAAYDSTKIIDTYFIAQENQEDLSKYQHFFNKHKKFDIFFLLDSPDCQVRRELIPILQSIVKTNPVEKFIEEHFSKEDIVAYNVYNISSTTSETWSTILVSIPFQPPFSNLLGLVIQSPLNFGGIYFLSLEFQAIIDNILLKTNNSNYFDHLQIFACITDSSGIKFVVKHHKDIIAVKTVEYPPDRTEMYVQGIIEQQITDYLISFKSYITRFELKVCLVFLVTEALKTLLTQSKFGEHSVVLLTDKDLQEPITTPVFKFSDSSIIETFAEKKNFLGLNKSIKTITHLNLLNFLIFKPLIALMIILVFVLANIKFNIWQNQQNTASFNGQYYQISTEYHNLKQRYPTIQNVTNLADLYSLEALLKIPVTTPFNLLDKISATLSTGMKLDKVSFVLLDPDSIVTTNENMQVAVSLRFAADSTLETTRSNIAEYIKLIEAGFDNFKVKYDPYLEQVTNLTDHEMVPFNFYIKGPKG